jgi:general secretion pathway protein D
MLRRVIQLMKKRPIFRVIHAFACIILLGACNSSFFKEVDTTAQTNTDTIAPEKQAEEVVAAPIQDKVLIQPSDAITDKRQNIIEIGDGQYTKPSINNNASSGDSEEGDITLNFQGTDINEFIKVILSDVLNYNFFIDSQVSGTVTIETARPLKTEELFPLLEEILAKNNAAIIEKNGIYQILPISEVVKGNLSPGTSKIENGYSVRIIPLQYIAAQEMQKILEPFVPDGGELRVDIQRNMVIVGGTPHELAQLQETIDIFDVDWLRGMSVGLYPLDYVDPKTLKTELDEVLGGVEGASNGQLLGGLVRTVSLERLNSLLLISSTASALREAEIWLYRLDRQGEQVGQNLYVYDVQNAKATEIADILGNIFGSSSTSNSSSRSDAQLAPGTTPVEIASENNTNETSTSSTTPSNPVSVGDSGLSLTSKGEVEIIADDTRNALVILASSRDYKMVAAAIKKLDVVPLQVLVEASILEVTLNGDLNYGVEWFFNNRVGSNRSGEGQLDLGAAGISALAPGFSYTIVNSVGNVKAALNALESESEINVLSAPSLMVLDNQTATINVGDEIPVPTRQSTSNIDPNAPTVNEIQFRDTGITLEVTPRVNNSGLVTMDIRQEVSNAVATTSSNIDAPTIQQRQIESTVAINSGETIVLGGLIRDSLTENESGIPGLYKIPLIGKIFGNTSVEERRTELIVLLTPRVVRSNVDAKKITDEFKRKLNNLPALNLDKTELVTPENAS